MKKYLKFFILILFFFIFLFGWLLSAQGKKRFPERYYQLKWCAVHKGSVEVKMKDGTRCDCVTSTHAVEVEFAEKWAEGIGQALNYSLQTRRIKKAGLLMIWKNDLDLKKIVKTRLLIKEYKLPIDVFVMRAE
jgi:hypothetical protein